MRDGCLSQRRCCAEGAGGRDGGGKSFGLLQLDLKETWEWL